MAKLSRIIQSQLTAADLKKIAARQKEESRVSKEKWLDENGKFKPLDEVPNEILGSHVRRLVAARRRQMDDELYNQVESDEFDPKAVRKSLKKLTFGPRMKALLRECARRGIPIHTER